MKRAIFCTRCRVEGKQPILAEVDDNGDIVILRFHKRLTRIRGSNFQVICDVCGEPSYYREEVNESPSIRVIGVRRVTLSGTLAGAGTASA